MAKLNNFNQLNNKEKLVLGVAIFVSASVLSCMISFNFSKYSNPKEGKVNKIGIRVPNNNKAKETPIIKKRPSVNNANKSTKATKKAVNDMFLKDFINN